MKKNKQLQLLLVCFTIIVTLTTPIWANSLTTSSGWLDCPFGEHNDHYPGKCKRYIDTDHDGICDHSEPPPEIRDFKYPSNGTMIALKIGNNEIYTGVFQNGKLLSYTKTSMDVAPFIDPTVNRTMVPLRFISENLGIQVNWNSQTREITLSESDKSLTIRMYMPISNPEKHGTFLVYPGSPTVTIITQEKTEIINLTNYNNQNMGIPFIYQSRTFVPLRFISEIFGATVNWYGETKSITITRGENQ